MAEYKTKNKTYSSKQELFRDIERWIHRTGKSLSEWKAQFKYEGPELKGRGRRKNGAPRISFDNQPGTDDAVRRAKIQTLTPDANTRDLANRVAKGINYFGDEADHTLSVDLQHAGLMSYEDPARQEQMRRTFQDAGLGFGHDPRNLQPLSKKENSIKQLQEKKIHSSKGLYSHLAKRPDVTSPDFPRWASKKAALIADLEAVADSPTIKYAANRALKTLGQALPLAGIGVGLANAGSALAAGNRTEAAYLAAETAAGEIPVVEQLLPTPVAGGTFKDVERRTAEGVRAKQLQQRAAEARKRGGKTSLSLGNLKVTLPEFGLSELLGIN